MKSFSFLLYLVAAAAALVIHAFVVVGAPPSIPGTKRKFNNDNDIIHSPSSPSTSSSSSTSFSSSVIPSSSSLINLESLSIHDNDHSSTAQAPTSPLQVNDLLFEIWSWLPSDADRLNLRYISRHFAEASRQRSYRLNNWAAFRFAAKTGNLALLERIASAFPSDRYPHTIPSMIMATTPNSTAQSRFFVNFMDFSDTLFPHPLSIAAYNGHVDIVTRIVDWSIEFGMDLFNSIFMETPMAFQSFMGFNGSIQTAENLETAVPEADRLAILHQFGRIVTIEADKALLVSKRDFSVFQEACQSGYSTIVSELYNEWVLDEAARVAMVSSHNYGNFVGAADAGSTLVLNLLYNWLPEASRSVIFTTPANRVCGHYSAFNRAASKGHLEAIRLMLNWITPEQTLVMMRAVNYKLFRTINHSEELVEYIYRFPLLQSTRDKLGMLSAGNWECFSNAVSEGHFDLAKKLWTWAGQVSPSGKRDILAANDFRAFKNAARGGHLDLMRWIWLQAPSDQQANMIESNNFEAYKRSQNEEIKQQILAWASSEEVRQRMLRPDIRIVRMEGVGGHLLKK